MGLGRIVGRNPGFDGFGVSAAGVSGTDSDRVSSDVAVVTGGVLAAGASGLGGSAAGFIVGRNTGLGLGCGSADFAGISALGSAGLGAAGFIVGRNTDLGWAAGCSVADVSTGFSDAGSHRYYEPLFYSEIQKRRKALAKWTGGSNDSAQCLSKANSVDHIVSKTGPPRGLFLPVLIDQNVPWPSSECCCCACSAYWL